MKGNGPPRSGDVASERGARPEDFAGAGDQNAGALQLAIGSGRAPLAAQGTLMAAAVATAIANNPVTERGMQVVMDVAPSP
jgi:hypothetical protein